MIASAVASVRSSGSQLTLVYVTMSRTGRWSARTSVPVVPGRSPSPPPTRKHRPSPRSAPSSRTRSVAARTAMPSSPRARVSTPRPTHPVVSRRATDHPNAADPQLGPLAQNGGLTPTLLPAETSPLVDAIPVSRVPGRRCRRGDHGPTRSRAAGDSRLRHRRGRGARPEPGGRDRAQVHWLTTPRGAVVRPSVS